MGWEEEGVDYVFFLFLFPGSLLAVQALVLAGFLPGTLGVFWGPQQGVGPLIEILCSSCPRGVIEARGPVQWQNLGANTWFPLPANVPCPLIPKRYQSQGKDQDTFLLSSAPSPDPAIPQNFLGIAV